MKTTPPPLPAHGASELPDVVVETYNAELRDTDGFVGDRASNGAFRAILEHLREQLRAVGGGLRGSRIGELVIGRTSVMLKAAGNQLDLTPIHHHPDEAGLVGAAHLVPRWMLAGHDAILAIDVGGSNLRAGVVKLGFKKA